MGEQLIASTGHNDALYAELCDFILLTLGSINTTLNTIVTLSHNVNASDRSFYRTKPTATL